MRENFNGIDLSHSGLEDARPTGAGYTLGVSGDVHSEAIAVLDASGTILYWSRAAEFLYGYPSAVAIGHRIHDVLSCYLSGGYGEISHALKTSGQWVGQITRLARSGRQLDVSVVQTLYSGLDDGTEFVIERSRILTDYAEPPKSDAPFKQKGYSAQLTPTIWIGYPVNFEPTKHSLESTFPALRYAPIVDVSGTMLQFLAASKASDILGLSLNELIVDPVRVICSNSGLIASGILNHTLITIGYLRTLERQEIQCMMVVSSGLDEASPLEVQVIDLTGRSREIEKSRRTEIRYSTLFQAMSSAVFTLDTTELLKAFSRLRSNGVTDFREFVSRHPEFLEEAFDFITVVEVNPSAVRMIGVEREEELLGPVGKYWSRQGIETFIRSLESGFYFRQGFEVRTKFQRPDGKMLDIHYSHNISPELRAERRLLLSLTDITEQVAAETALLEMNNSFAHHGRLAMLGELSASISHELSQPLGAIMNFAAVGRRLIQRDPLDKDKMLFLQDRIVEDAQRAADIIARTRQMAGKRPTERSTTAVNSLVQDALRFLDHELRSNSVAFQTDLAATDVLVEVDPVQMQQVVVNLVLNAIQEMRTTPLGKRALLVSTARVAGGGTTIAVSDRGPGISAENLPRLFENFFTTKKTGLGMGLSICKQIVEAHGGQIFAENHLDGARFTIALPESRSGDDMG